MKKFIKNLVLVPTLEELDAVVDILKKQDIEFSETRIGPLELYGCSQGSLVFCHGGFGKTQFGIHTQFLIDKIQDASSVICIGAGGALVNGFSFGDIVVATEIIEHDLKNHIHNLKPRFQTSKGILSEIHKAANKWEIRDLLRDYC